MYIFGPIIYLTIFSSGFGQTNDTSKEKKTAIINFIKKFIKDKIEEDKGTELVGIRKLYGGKCRIKLFNYTITEPGCEPKTVETNVCAGKCNSLFIPNINFSLCYSCKPSSFTKRTVLLDCFSKTDNKKIRSTKVITEVETCNCNSC